MKKTIQAILDKDLTITEMRVIMNAIILELEGKSPFDVEDISVKSGIGRKRCGDIVRVLKDINVISLCDVPDGRSSKAKYYTIALPEFTEECSLLSYESTSMTVGAIHIDHENSKKDILPITSDDEEPVDMVGENLGPDEEDPMDTEMAILRMSAERRLKAMSERDEDAIASLKKAKENRENHKHEPPPKNMLMSRDITVDNEKLIESMKKKFKRMANMPNDVICVLYTMNYAYPDVTGQHIGAVTETLANAIKVAINAVGFDDLIKILMGRRIHFNGTNFSTYWARQFTKTIPNLRKNGFL